MSTLLGKTIIKRKGERSFEPGVGWRYVDEWEGTDKAAIDGKSKLYQNEGWQVDIQHNTPKYTLRATSFDPSEGAVEDPIVRWSWHKEILQRPIWSHPLFAQVAQSWGNPQEFRKIVEESIESGKSYTEIAALLTPSDSLAGVVLELQQGVDSYETEYVIVSRERHTTPEYASRIALNANGLLYTTSDFINQFAVPGVVAASLPANGEDPGTNRAWTWRMRSQSGDYEGPDVFIERQEFAFAAWSTLIYDLFTP